MFAKTIATKYLFSRKKENFINLVSIFAVLSVALGVAVLNIAMSIMNGFEFELQRKLIGSAHVQVRSFQGTVRDYPDLSDQLKKYEAIKKVKPFAESQVLLSNRRLSAGFLLKAWKGEDLRFNSTSSKLPQLAITKATSTKFGLTEGSQVQLLSPKVSSSPFGLIPRQGVFLVNKVIESDGTVFDESYLYTDLSSAQKFLNLKNEVSGLEIELINLENSSIAKDWIKSNLVAPNQSLYVQDWTDLYPGIWEAISLEKRAYFIVLLLLIVLASFSIITCLIMIVLEKQKDIAILRTLGAKATQIRSIFMLMGVVIGFAGTVLGLGLGYAGCQILKHVGFNLPNNVFPTNTLPVVIDSSLFVLVGALAFVICLLATIYPAHRATKLKPSDLLRYQ